MAIDSKFYQVAKPLTLADVQKIAALEVLSDRGHLITHACAPDEAQTGALIFIGSKDYLAQLSHVAGITILTTSDLAPSCTDEASIVVSKAPRVAFAQILAALYQQDVKAVIADTAQIAPDASIGRNVSIGDYAIIEAGAVIGDDVVIGAHCVIGAQCQIGAKTIIKSHVAIHCAYIGENALIEAHAVIGKSGFGFEMTATGAVMIPHLGTVQLGNHVHIGAHSVVDKGVLGATIIADDVMIDNHVHVAHNVQIGEKCIILAQVGIAGSAVIGKNVILAGQVGVKDHVTIADRVVILSAAKVTKNIEEAGTYGGYPAIPAKQHWREQVALRKLAAVKNGKGE